MRLDRGECGAISQIVGEDRVFWSMLENTCTSLQSGLSQHIHIFAYGTISVP
jgi:hypothetical protein